MNTFNVNVSISVDFSENAKNFLSNLLEVKNSLAAEKRIIPTSSENVSEKTETEYKRGAAVPESTQASVSVAPPSDVTIDDVRQALAAKVSNHREEIKSKLSELGAPSVTRLNPDKYVEMLIFLNELS